MRAAGANRQDPPARWAEMILRWIEDRLERTWQNCGFPSEVSAIAPDNQSEQNKPLDGNGGVLNRIVRPTLTRARCLTSRCAPQMDRSASPQKTCARPLGAPQSGDPALSQIRA